MSPHVCLKMSHRARSRHFCVFRSPSHAPTLTCLTMPHVQEVYLLAHEQTASQEYSTSYYATIRTTLSRTAYTCIKFHCTHGNGMRCAQQTPHSVVIGRSSETSSIACILHDLLAVLGNLRFASVPVKSCSSIMPVKISRVNGAPRARARH